MRICPMAIQQSKRLAECLGVSLVAVQFVMICQSRDVMKA